MLTTTPKQSNTDEQSAHPLGAVLTSNDEILRAFTELRTLTQAAFILNKLRIFAVQTPGWNTLRHAHGYVLEQLRANIADSIDLQAVLEEAADLGNEAAYARMNKVGRA